MDGKIEFGTCSWNYESWVGLVYSEPRRTAAEYLPEYAAKFETAEIDSWFYRIPSRADVLSYKALTPEGFSFTCKVPQDITLTHERNFKKGSPPKKNETFLSVPKFEEYLSAIEPLLEKIEAIMLEFEYLNKDKMSSLQEFLDRLGDFFSKVPQGLPSAVEPRNGNSLTREYFAFLKERGLIHVFSEKQFMPHVYDVYRDFGVMLGDAAVVRLLGGDRKEIEKLSREQWNAIVAEKPDKGLVAGMSRDMKMQGKRVIVNVNNHYEGSAPLTVEELRRLSA